MESIPLGTCKMGSLQQVVFIYKWPLYIARFNCMALCWKIYSLSRHVVSHWSGLTEQVSLY